MTPIPPSDDATQRDLRPPSHALRPVAIGGGVFLLLGVVSISVLTLEIGIEFSPALSDLEHALRLAPRALSLLLICTCVVGLAAAPLLLARSIAHNLSALVLLPFALLGVDALLYLPCRLALTGAALETLVGSLSLPWPHEVERLARFGMLCAAVQLPLVPLHLAFELVAQKKRSVLRRTALWFLTLLVCALLALGARAMWLHWSQLHTISDLFGFFGTKRISADVWLLALALLIAAHAALLARTLFLRPRLALLLLLIVVPGASTARQLVRQAKLSHTPRNVLSAAEPADEAPISLLQLEDASQRPAPTPSAVEPRLQKPLAVLSYTGLVLLLSGATLAALLFAQAILPGNRTHVPRRQAEVLQPPCRSTYALAALGWLFLIVYGSLVPFHFDATGLDEALHRFAQAPYFDLGIEQRQDFVANILLYVPLGFLALGALRSDRRGWTSGLSSALLVLMATASIALGLEWLQVWFPPRTVSWNDIVAEWIGSVVGMALWAVGGQEVTDGYRSLREARSRRVFIARALSAYAPLFLFLLLVPLDAVVTQGEFARKVATGRVIVWPFAHAFDSVSAMIWGLFGSVLLAIPLGALLVFAAHTKELRRRALAGLAGCAAASASIVAAEVLLFGNTVTLAQLWPGAAALVPLFGLVALSLFVSLRPCPWRIASIGFGILLLSEFAQLFVYSRNFDVTDLLTGSLGLALGAALGAIAVQRRASIDLGISSATWRFLAALAAAFWSLLLLAIYWYPMRFQTTPEIFSRRVSALLAPPFQSYYWGTEFHAFTQISRKIALAVPLGIFTALALPASALQKKKHRTFGLLALGLSLFFCGIEFGQALLPERVPDLTDAMVSTAGALSGVALVRLFAAAARRP